MAQLHVIFGFMVGCARYSAMRNTISRTVSLTCTYVELTLDSGSHMTLFQTAHVRLFEGD